MCLVVMLGRIEPLEIGIVVVEIGRRDSVVADSVDFVAGIVDSRVDIVAEAAVGRRGTIGIE